MTLTAEQIAERQKNDVEAPRSYQHIVDYYKRTSGMYVDSYGRVLVKLTIDDKDAYVVAKYDHANGWQPRVFGNGDAEQLLPAYPRHITRRYKATYDMSKCTGHTPKCIDLSYADYLNEKVNEDGTRTITNAVEIASFGANTTPILYLHEEAWQPQIHTQTIRNGRGIAWKPDDMIPYNPRGTGGRSSSAGLPENNALSSRRTGFAPLTFAGAGMEPPKDSQGRMVDPWNPINGYDGEGVFYTHTEGLDSTNTQKVVLNENTKGAQAWQNGDLSYTGSETARIAFTAFWRTFLDPVGSIIDLADGTYTKHNLNYGLEDFLIDAGSDLLFPGGVIRGGARITGKALASTLEKLGARSMSKIVVESGETGLDLMEAWEKTVARAETLAGDATDGMIGKTSEEIAKKEAYNATRSGVFTDTVKALEDIDAYKAMPMLADDETKLAGFLSQNVYKSVEERPDRIGDFIKRGDLSTVETGVYVNDKTKEVFFSMRGSVSVEDWTQTDVAIAVNAQAFTERFARTESELLRVHNIADYADYKITITGHSLAGGSAYYLAEKYATEPWFARSIGFNAASSPIGETVKSVSKDIGMISKESIEAMDKKVINVRQGMDLVSGAGFTHGETRTYISTGGWNPGSAHKMDAFTDTTYARVQNPKRFSELIKKRMIDEGWHMSFRSAGQGFFGIDGTILDSLDNPVAGTFDFVFGADGSPIDFTVDDIGNDGDDYSPDPPEVAGGIQVAEACNVQNETPYIFGGNPYESQEQKRQLVEDTASYEVNSRIDFTTMATGSQVSHNVEGIDMVCTYASPAQCFAAHTINTDTCKDVPSVDSITTAKDTTTNTPPNTPTDTTSDTTETTTETPTQTTTETNNARNQTQTQQTNGTQLPERMRTGSTVLERLIQMNPRVIGYVMYTESQKQKYGYNFIAY